MNATIRQASVEDLAGVKAGVDALLMELRGSGISRDGFDATFRALVAGDGGGVIVAEDDASDAIVGVLAYSLQVALRTGGLYAEIQELWVDASQRGRAVGTRLIEHLRERAIPHIRQIEVGLPSEHFAGRDSTQAFYERCGFSVLGVRARWSAV